MAKIGFFKRIRVILFALMLNLFVNLFNVTSELLSALFISCMSVVILVSVLEGGVNYLLLMKMHGLHILMAMVCMIKDMMCPMVSR